jgi:hypothetical protein
MDWMVFNDVFMVVAIGGFRKKATTRRTNLSFMDFLFHVPFFWVTSIVSNFSV